MNKFYELDKMIIAWWEDTDDVSLGDMSKHLSEDSIVNGEFADNFLAIVGRKMSFGEEHMKC